MHYPMINKFDDPIRFQETSYESCLELYIEDGKGYWGSDVFHGPDCDIIDTDDPEQCDYQWHFHVGMDYWREIKRDINPDIPLQKELYDSGCDVNGYDPNLPTDDPEMIHRTHQDCCVVTKDHNGQDVLARISEKREERVTWQYDPEMWHKALPSVPMDLIIKFTKALRELQWSRTETRHLLYGYLRVTQEHVADIFHHPGDSKHVPKYNTTDSAWVNGLTNPDMPYDILIKRLNQIIEASEICNMRDLYDKEKADCIAAGYESESISDQMAYYKENADGSYSLVEVSYATQYDSDYAGHADYDNLEGDDIIAINLSDGMDQTNDAVTHTIVPFKHVNNDLPWWLVNDIMQMSWNDLMKFQDKLIDKKQNYNWHMQFSSSQINQLWDYLNERRVKLNKAPLKSKIDLYEVKHGRWQLKGYKPLKTRYQWSRLNNKTNKWEKLPIVKIQKAA